MSFRIQPSIIKFTVTLLIAFIVQQSADQFFNQHLFSWFALSPDVYGRLLPVWQILTYVWIHQDPLTLIFNCLGLIFFGSELVATWGQRIFWTFGITIVVGSAFSYLLASNWFTLPPLAGTTPLLYGILTAYGVIYSNRTILFMGVLPMRTRDFISMLILLAMLTVIFAPQSRAIGLIHMSGIAVSFLALGGMIFLRSAKGRSKLRLSRHKNHLKLVQPTKNSVSDQPPKKPTTWH